MPFFSDLDNILQQWRYQPGTVSARLVRASDGREVLQMRVELGLLQMETSGRPDGTKPGGAETYLDYLLREAFHWRERGELTGDQLDEVDRELSQFYQRRVCWLAVREFDRAAADANHSLTLMDFLEQYEVDDEWRRALVPQRRLAIFHRAQATALAHLEQEGAEAAVEVINGGVKAIERLGDMEDDRSEACKMVRQLRELQDWVRDEYRVDRTLAEQLADAVAAEEYERAATLRDELARRERRA